MKIPQDPQKYLSKWRFVEVAYYWPKGDKVVRLKRNKLPVLMEWKDVERFSRQHADTGIYTSVWHYNSRDLDRATRLGSLYFDLDCDAIERAREEAIKLVDYLSEFVPASAIQTYFTGKKGFHIECEAITLGITPSNDLHGLFRYIANQLVEQLNLSTVDFAVYDIRRMWRVPNTRHQGTQLYKVGLSRGLLESSISKILVYAKEPRSLNIAEPAFDFKANEWYREWGYKQEESSTFTAQDRIDRFIKYGTSSVRDVSNQELEFDPVNLFDNCHAILELWTKAEKTHDLSHEERLFLCSILSYTEEARNYLHVILSNCDDYSPARSEAHIQDWVRRREMDIGGRPYSCERANSVGVGCGNCELKPMERYESIRGKLVATGEMAHPSPKRFAYKTRKKKDE